VVAQQYSTMAEPGLDFMILKIFSTKNFGEKIGVFMPKLLVVFAKK
jgi:hypothetical protein